MLEEFEAWHHAVVLVSEGCMIGIAALSFEVCGEVQRYSSRVSLIRRRLFMFCGRVRRQNLASNLCAYFGVYGMAWWIHDWDCQCHLNGVPLPYHPMVHP
jgi:hypothetical protein